MTSPTTTSTHSGTQSPNPGDEIAATLEKLEAKAETVRTLTEDFDAATEAELDAKVMVLERALKAVAPVPRAICEPIASEHVSWVGTSREECVTYFPQRGVLLAGSVRRDGYAGNGYH